MSGVLPTKNGLLIPPIKTPDNTLDDGSGNATIAGSLSAGTTTVTGAYPFILYSGGLGAETLSSGALGAWYSGVGVQASVTAESNTAAFAVVSSDDVKAINITTAGNATLAGGLTANGIALAVTPSVATLATNPPASGTAYQWAGPGKLELSCPVTLNPTSSAAATAALNIGPTSTPSNQIDYASRPAGLTAADGEIVTLRATIPAGWYWSVGITNATIGTCVGIAS